MKEINGKKIIRKKNNIMKLLIQKHNKNFINQKLIKIIIIILLEIRMKWKNMKNI